MHELLLSMWCGGGAFGEEERGTGAGKIFLHVSLRGGRGRSGGSRGWTVGCLSRAVGWGIACPVAAWLSELVCRQFFNLLSLLVSKVPADE